jgi:soluble lytic murein transglycosylase-like protein
MTKPWFHKAVRIRSVPTLAVPNHHRVTAGVLGIGLILVLLVSGATAPLDARPAEVLTALPTTFPDARLAAPHPGRGSAALADPGIEAVARIVARKYRVSQEATREFIRTAYREGARHGVDPLLIVSVMAVESRFNPVAQSDGGAMGLMQVIPRFHAEKFQASDNRSVLDPGTNIQVGVKILKEYIGRGGNELAGLQLYNGASGDVSFAYATRVLGEKQWLQDAVRRSSRERAPA